MKEKLVIIARLLQAKQVTVDEAVLLLEEKTQPVILLTPTWTNPNPWDTGRSPIVTYAANNYDVPFSLTTSNSAVLTNDAQMSFTVNSLEVTTDGILVNCK